MDKDTAPRFDWIGWYTAIPGIPADWPRAAEPCEPDDGFDGDDWPELKAA